MKKSNLYGGLLFCGVLGMAGMSGHASQGKVQPANLRQRQTQAVSGEITHIDEDSFAVWGYRAGSNAVFENLRVKEGDKVYKLIHLGPSSYKVGDKVEGLEFKCLENGISVADLNDLLTSTHTRSQTGYVEADGIITRYLPENIQNQ